LFVESLIIEHHFYYIYAYFYIICAILLIGANLKYAELKQNSVVFYTGAFPNRKYVEFNWENIKSVNGGPIMIIIGLLQYLIKSL
jgi:hypothetical protein